MQQGNLSFESVMMPLHIERAERIADDIQKFILRDPKERELPEFTAGAHITVRVPNGLLRKFSLCNDPTERDRYVIAVKRVADGRGGSISLVDGARAGDAILVAPPINDFRLPQQGKEFIFIAGGIGITPIMAMIHEIRMVQGKNFKLYYCTRSPESTAFLHDLIDPQLRDNVVIHHDQGEPGRVLDLSPIVAERKNRAHLFCCGPRPLMEAVRRQTKHWSPAAVHFEAFGDADVHKRSDVAFAVKIVKSGDVIEVAAGVTILEAMRARGYDVPSSCESGTCGTCRFTLVEGEVDHRDLVLTDDERSRAIMICVSRAKSPQLVIDR